MNNEVVNNLTPMKKRGFEELKKSITADYGPAEADDFRIYRFFKARDFDVMQANRMLRNNLEWRKKEKIDTILQDYKAPKVLEDFWPMYILGYDTEGSPIMVFEFGNTDFKGILKSVKKEEILKHTVYLMELGEHYFREQSKKLGRSVETWIGVLDFGSLTLAQVISKACIEYMIICATCYENNYPERLKTCYILNASTYFTVFYNTAKVLLSSNTLSKMKIFGKEGWKEDLRKVISSELLPEKFGGSKENHPNYLSTAVNGGLVPEQYYFKSTERRLSTKPETIEYILKRNGKVEIPLVVDLKRSVIEWQFETEKYDVGFGLSYREKEDDYGPPQVLIPVQRTDAHMTFERGTHICQEPGIYILTFDNSHSWFWQKQLFCKTSVNKPD